MADIVEPLGAMWKLPIPMKWQHGKDPRIGADQIGEITSAVKSPDGIRVKGTFWKFQTPPSLKDDYDRIWALVKAGMRGLSIGFSPIEYEPIKGTGGMRFLKWQFLELSPVTIAANQDASITSIKSFDQAARASSGTSRDYPSRNASPVASGTSKQPRSTTMKGIPDQIEAIEEDRATAQTRIDELKTKSNGDPDELDAAEQHELDDLAAKVISMDTKARRLHTMQGTISKAAPITSAIGNDPDRSSRVRGGDFQMKSNLPKGTMFARAAHAKIQGIKSHWSMNETAAHAAKLWPDTPLVGMYLKAAVGTGAAGNWAEPLNPVNTVEGEFIEELRPATIVGRLGLRPAPFNTKMIVQGPANSSANWVGNGAVKPVGEGVYDTVEIGRDKIAEIMVLTQDQIMSSAINSVEATRRDLIARIAQFADEQFLDPSVADGANNPASVLNGVDDVPAGGSTGEDLLHDISVLMNRFIAYNIPLTNVTLIVSSYIAWGLGGLRNPLGQRFFPDVNINGGNIDGMRVLVSNNVGGSSSGSNIVAVVPSLILLADNGGIKVDLSEQATISMTGAATADHSLWQRNEVGLRCEWFVSWAKAHPQAAQYISGAAYAPAAP
jgi:HK97 family phage major capsid protein